LEVGYVPLSLGGAYPGLYLFTSPSRFLRPVRNISHTTDHNIELIGPFEQVKQSREQFSFLLIFSNNLRKLFVDVMR